ncbi:MAG: hypothetical protein mread185_000390 [Mycoplasmataceae bacterium]|nr:MAG: hypothetical protein mread185_000390 [Mycoplasmataceae bacterium]
MKEKFTNSQKFIKNLTDQNEALELAPFDKRLESLNQFSEYREKIKELKETELSKVASKELVLSKQTELILIMITVALSINLLTK